MLLLLAFVNKISSRFYLKSNLENANCLLAGNIFKIIISIVLPRMYSSFYSPRSRNSQNKITSSPIFKNQASKEHVKSSDYQFDAVSRDSNSTSTDYQPQRRLEQSSSASSLTNSERQIQYLRTLSDRGLTNENNYSCFDI